MYCVVEPRLATNSLLQLIFLLAAMQPSTLNLQMDKKGMLLEIYIWKSIKTDIYIFFIDPDWHIWFQIGIYSHKLERWPWPLDSWGMSFFSLLVSNGNAEVKRWGNIWNSDFTQVVDFDNKTIQHWDSLNENCRGTFFENIR